MRRMIGSGLAALVVASCSGASPPPPPPPPPPPAAGPNRAPAFQTGAAVTVQENVAAAFLTLQASDPDGDAISFSLTGGVDQGAFRLGPNGALSFAEPPDFEAPGDRNGDNVYEAAVTATDGRGAQAGLALQITVTDRPGGVQARIVGQGFQQPLFLTGLPDGSGRVLVAQQGGLVRLLDPDTGSIAATPFLDVSASIRAGGEQGLLGLALAPNFLSSGLLYIHVTNLSGDTEIRTLRTAPGGLQADPASSDVIFTLNQPFDNHNGGWLGFGSDGFLYAALGDGGGANDPQNNAQNLSTTLGKILRLDVSGDAFPTDASRDYRIPPDNPFAAGGGAPEIWASGLRNPFRASFDRQTGNLLIGDVGQDLREEIDLAPAGVGGLNFGWSFFEGAAPGPRSGGPGGLTPPVAEYPHGSGALEGFSVTGGYVYRGPVVQLRGLYVFGDFVNRRVWSAPIASLQQGATLANTSLIDRTLEWAPTAGPFSNIASFGEDAVGNLYIVEFNGRITRLEEID